MDGSHRAVHSITSASTHISKQASSGNSRILPKPIVAAAMLTVLLGLAGAFFMLSRGASVAMAVFIASVLLALCECQTYVQFFSSPKPCFIGPTDCRFFGLTLLGSAAAAFLLEMGTLAGASSSSIFVMGDWRIKRVALFFMCSYMLALLAYEYVPADAMDRVKRFVTMSLPKMAKALTVAFLLAAALSVAVAYTVSRFLGLSLASQIAFWFFIAFSVALLLLHFKFDYFSLEFTVLLAILLAGSSTIAVIPVSNLLSWDDEIHYANALNLSYFSDVEFTSSDIMLTRLFDIQEGHTLDASMDRRSVDYSRVWTDGEIKDLTDEMNGGYSRGVVQINEGIGKSTVSYTVLGYAPSAVGLWLGRLFHLPLSGIFMLGRFANLLSYALVCFFAIKIIPCKKVLMSVLALLPTSIFMASNYAYDPWVISFGFLSVALIVRTMVSTDELSAHVVFAIILSFFLGLAPKAVYFPLIGLMFLIPTKRLSPKARRDFYLSIIALGLLVVATFLLPLIVSNGGGAGDARGGEGVNSSEQLKYVLSNPGAYASTMFNFLSTEYLTPASFGSATLQWAYLSNLSVIVPATSYVVLGIVAIVAILDSDETSSGLNTMMGRIWTLIIIGVAIFGICTALYLSFTPVALGWINGVQPRYLLPLVFPLLVFACNIPIAIKKNAKWFATVFLGLMTGLFAYTSWMLLFSRLVA